MPRGFNKELWSGSWSWSKAFQSQMRVGVLRRQRRGPVLSQGGAVGEYRERVCVHVSVIGDVVCEVTTMRLYE